MKTRVLIVEDDLMVQALLAAHLQNLDYDVSLASTGKEMLACIDSERINIILLDLGLPDEDGLTLTRQVRARSDIPIIVLMVWQGKSDKIAALELGADDYLTKPFDPDELLLRRRNILDRSLSSNEVNNEKNSETYHFSGWVVDMKSREVESPDGENVIFTRAEFNLLVALIKAPNRVLNRSQLLDAISQDADSPTDRLIDVLISRIRKKIELNPRKPELIITVQGCGYKFSASLR